MFPKNKRIEDEEVLESFRRLPCVVCDCAPPSDPCHITSKGAGGGDAEENLISMCREHHQEQHGKGWIWMCEQYYNLKVVLEGKGRHDVFRR
ncbi:unnamed protein product [marine sediment metagenome]|uniref:HNH nuclease domain-containing protein n=1 Tax=marine sediment metagenome TaxID=412755 RepID=X0U729_9ZZZZ